jgi:hypothetical protein
MLADSDGDPRLALLQDARCRKVVVELASLGLGAQMRTSLRLMP